MTKEDLLKLSDAQEHCLDEIGRELGFAHKVTDLGELLVRLRSLLGAKRESMPKAPSSEEVAVAAEGYVVLARRRQTSALTTSEQSIQQIAFEAGYRTGARR